MTANGDEPMATTILLPRALRPYADGSAEIVCDGPCDTMRDTLARLAGRHPALVDRILTERGELRQHVNLFVEEEDIRFLGGLDASVHDGATVSIVPAVSGG